jgi:DNA polymerase-3 subunit delta
MSATPHHVGGIPAACYLITGEDLGLVSQELSALVSELTGLSVLTGAIVEEYTQATKEDPVPIGAVLDACRTPPFLTDRRLIVVRDGENLDAAQTKEVVAYLKDPLETTIFILVVGGKSASATLRKAFGAAGYVVDAQPGANARARDEWFSEHLATAPVRLEGAALGLLKAHLGEDVARLEGILGALAAAYGPGSMIRPDELEPFLGSEGSVAPWDLTDAIDAGDTSKALHTLSRMMEAGERHPLQILATLHRHIGAMLRLDGEDAFGEVEAARAVGMNAYPAGKALRQCRRLGHVGVSRAVALLADADIDLRGRAGWPPELVMEVLVARLSQLSRVRGAQANTSAGAGHRNTTQRRRPQIHR